MKTNIYIDAFNLYYGCLKNSPFKWLNLYQLAQFLLPNDQVNKIKYFTARVISRPNNPDQGIRQQTYIRALDTLPDLSVIYGHFLTSEVMMPLVQPQGGIKYAKVFKTEEKGSDVNIATHLLNDGHKGEYELAVIISNDSDLVEPIRIVRQELGLQVGVFNPQINSKHPSVQLQKTATFFKQIRKPQLAASQFASTLTDANGTFTKPTSW